MFRLFEKKRGARRTGSRFLGSMGEGLFFTVLFLVGFIALIAVITAELNPMDSGRPLTTGWWLVMLVLVSFVLIGGAGVIYTFMQVGTSAERRSALAGKARSL